MLEDCKISQDSTGTAHSPERGEGEDKLLGKQTDTAEQNRQHPSHPVSQSFQPLIWYFTKIKTKTFFRKTNQNKTRKATSQKLLFKFSCEKKSERELLALPKQEKNQTTHHFGHRNTNSSQ